MGVVFGSVDVQICYPHAGGLNSMPTGSQMLMAVV